MPSRPNVLIFLSDDHSTFDTGCYGNEVVRTPHIDSLGRDGMRCNRAFTPTAMCAPSRSCMYTGLFPHRNGCHMNHGRVVDGTRSLPHYLQPLGYRVALAEKRHIAPASAFPFEYIAQADVPAFLDDAAGDPFCLVVASHQPHTPHEGGDFSPAEVPIHPFQVDTPQMRRLQADYYADIERCDAELGEALSALDRRGLADNTLVIYAGDHGYGIFAKWTCYEAGLRVPFIARWPERIAAGAVTDAMVSFADVLPTCLDLADAEPSANLDGWSFLPVLSGAADAHRDAIFGCHTTRGIISGSTFPIRSVRTKTHKYISNLAPGSGFRNIMTHPPKGNRHESGRLWRSWVERAETDDFAASRVALHSHRPAEELYDLRADPWELSNLAADPAQAAALAALRTRLDCWMAEQADLGLEAELTVPAP